MTVRSRGDYQPPFHSAIQMLPVRSVRVSTIRLPLKLRVTRIAAPLATLHPKWPFRLQKALPRAHATSPGGTDSSSFEMASVPTLNFATTTARPGPDGKDVTYQYNYAWHTLNDLYTELVPYTEHQQESALVTAVVAYGVANLDKPLTRDGVYLADGLYATIAVGAGDAQKQILTTLDYANAPVQVANFIRIVEGTTPPAGGGRGGGGRGGPGGQPEAPPIGAVDVVKGQIQGVIASPTQKSFAVPSLPKAINPALMHDSAGVVGVSAPNAFYITLGKNAALDRKFTAIGRVVASLGSLNDIKRADPIRSIRITRVGQAARDFKTDDETFKKLIESATKKK